MSWFYDMKIGKKLLSSFMLLAILAGAVGLIGVINMNKLDGNYTDLYENYGIAVGDLGEAGMDYHNIRSTVRSMLLTEDEAERAQLKQTISELDARMDEAFARFQKRLPSAALQNQYDSFAATLEQYNVQRDRAVELAIKGDISGALKVVNDASPIAQKADAEVKSLFQAARDEGGVRSGAYSSSANTTVTTMIVVVVVAVAIAIGLGLFISSMIGKPIRTMVEAAEQIASGDLTRQIEIRSRDETGQLADAFRRMTDNLNEVVSNIQAASDQVAAGARQMSESSLLLSQGATEQASSVEQLTVSLEEISGQTKLNADNAALASNLAEQTRGNAVQSNTRMQEMLRAMDDINSASGSISKIIKVIDEIAFQTNILALNAAVEAARAGQHGKGFAVVAEEVRNLAARSAGAAKETTDMIEGSIRNVEAGMKIAGETASALERMLGDVDRVAELIEGISRASGEQAAGISQINQGLLQVSQVIQTNSSTSEESAAASEELTGQADMLRGQVSRFRLRGRQGYGAGGYVPSARARRTTASAPGGARSPDDAFAEVAAGMDSFSLSDREFGKY